MLEDIKDLPSHIKARMGRSGKNKNGVLPPQPHNGKQQKMFGRDYKDVKGKNQKAAVRVHCQTAGNSQFLPSMSIRFILNEQ